MAYTQSIAEQLLSEYKSSDDLFRWIITYDFIDGKPPPKFWKNLAKMMSISSVKRIQYSVFTADNKGDALAVAHLAEHYGGMVEVFRCVEI